MRDAYGSLRRVRSAMQASRHEARGPAAGPLCNPVGSINAAPAAGDGEIEPLLSAAAASSGGGSVTGSAGGVSAEGAIAILGGGRAGDWGCFQTKHWVATGLVWYSYALHVAASYFVNGA